MKVFLRTLYFFAVTSLAGDIVFGFLFLKYDIHIWNLFQYYSLLGAVCAVLLFPLSFIAIFTNMRNSHFLKAWKENWITQMSFAAGKETSLKKLANKWMAFETIRYKNGNIFLIHLVLCFLCLLGYMYILGFSQSL